MLGESPSGDRADYGLELIKTLSRQLTEEYGKGFSRTDLYWYVRFFKAFPEIFASLSKISVPTISWTHFRTLLQVEDSAAREWYTREAATQAWSVRTLQRNISSQYYYRLLQSQHKDLVKKEMLQRAESSPDDAVCPGVQRFPNCVNAVDTIAVVRFSGGSAH